MTCALGYTKYDWKNKGTSNSRNGHSSKTVKSQFGEIDLDVPRDAKGEFEPVIVKKHERTVSTELEDIIVSLFASGMSDRDIEGQMRRVYGVEVSAEMVSKVTDKILPLAREWQNRALQPLYPIIFLDGIMFNVRQDGHVVKKTAYLVFAITVEGGARRSWASGSGRRNPARFWMSILADLKNRGVKDILIACVDGLNGFEEGP